MKFNKKGIKAVASFWGGFIGTGLYVAMIWYLIEEYGASTILATIGIPLSIAMSIFIYIHSAEENSND
jgi:hypothetical protein